MKEVLIEIEGTQQYPDSDVEKTSLTTKGTLSFSKDKVLIAYSESELIGASDVKSEIVIENNGLVTLTRSGGMQSRLIIEKGRRHSCLYNTPQGDFVMGFFGDKINCQIDENGGSLYMSYTIDVNSGLLSKNTMKIQVKEII